MMRLLSAQHLTYPARGWLTVLSSSAVSIAGPRCQQPAVSLESELCIIEQMILAIGREMIFLEGMV